MGRLLSIEVHHLYIAEACRKSWVQTVTCGAVAKCSPTLTQYIKAGYTQHASS
jgi:hypothetical protein